MEKKPRSPLLSARIDWIVLEILILFVLTVVYTVIIWLDESGNSSQTVLETFKATVKEVVPFSQYSLFVIVGLFELGGEIMLRYTHKIQQALEQGKVEGIEQGKVEGIEQGKVEGIEQGKAEIYRAWYADWKRRQQEAKEKGLPFNDPPPPNPDDVSDET